jgi:predicted Zn-dependent protease with MMP-like domain
MSATNPNWEQLLSIADQEVARIVRDLPADLRAKARTLPLTFEPKPNVAWLEDGIEVDSLGLFVGPAYGDETQSGSPLPAQIILFLENLWDMAEGDESIYREELRRTYLHELGHFLGLEEDDLWERGLD